MRVNECVGAKGAQFAYFCFIFITPDTLIPLPQSAWGCEPGYRQSL
jgi:hypothetical protein